MNIKPMMNAINTAANRTIDYGNKITTKFMESKPGHTLMPENPTDVAKLLALVSTTTKDAVNCYYYTTQSYTNEKIPEDKRKFVAGIDLANGILNVITQLTLGLFVNKQSDKWFDKCFKGGIAPTNETVKAYVKKAEELLKKSSLTKHIECTEADMRDAIKKTNKIAKGGFGVIAVLIVTQIIAKRMIVPFLSTPLAGYFKNYLEKREQQSGVKPAESGEQSQEVKQDNKEAVKIEKSEELKTQKTLEDPNHKAFKGFEQFLAQNK